MGIYFDMSKRGVIQIVWNHMQMDGVGLWGTTREIYDDNPPLVPYKEVKSPPPNPSRNFVHTQSCRTGSETRFPLQRCF